MYVMYLEEFLTPKHFFFLTITTITIHDIKLMMTTALTAPTIGTGKDDESVLVDCSVDGGITKNKNHSLM